MAEGPVLVGIGGMVQGEEFPLWRGATVVIGRSRGCDISLRRCKAWLGLSDEEQERQEDFNTVSRKHVRVSYPDADKIEVEDLSSNGTFLDGQRVTQAVITDLRERSHELLLGTREKFRIEWKSEDPSGPVPG